MKYEQQLNKSEPNSRPLSRQRALMWVTLKWHARWRSPTTPIESLQQLLSSQIATFTKLLYKSMISKTETTIKFYSITFSIWFIIQISYWEIAATISESNDYFNQIIVQEHDK